MKNCYNCGIPLDEKTITREHIPAQGLFEGYGDDYKKNRLVVPACKTCNNQYSVCDEEFRNMIGIMSNDSHRDKISEKSARSILRKDKQKHRLFIENGNVEAVSFDLNHIEQFHIKNFKGLFYEQYGEPISNEEYFFHVNIDASDYSELTMSVIGYLKHNFDWKHSGHPDIFQYILQPHRENVNPQERSGIIVENPNSENCYVCLIKYNKSHATLVTAMKKDFLDKTKQQ
jgi:hypothetical protein